MLSEKKLTQISLFAKMYFFVMFVNTTLKPQMHLQFKSIRNILKVLSLHEGVNFSTVGNTCKYSSLLTDAKYRPIDRV